MVLQEGSLFSCLVYQCTSSELLVEKHFPQLTCSVFVLGPDPPVVRPWAPPPLPYAGEAPKQAQELETGPRGSWSLEMERWIHFV